MGAPGLRVLRPAEGVRAFYEGRVEGQRFAEGRNWVDEGAIGLGIASYAVVAGAEAVVYDTHVSVDRAGLIRETLEEEGVRNLTVVLSHWHLDHVAGTEAFADCEVIACERTAELLTRSRAAIEHGELEGPPAIDPLILPTRTFSGRMELSLGGEPVELIQTDVHSDDAVVAWLPGRRLLLCGDTMEDTVTWVDEPESLDTHLENLEGLRRLDPDRILPNHGDPEVIAAGGYPAGLIDATERYIEALLRCRADPELREASLRELISDSLASGALNYFQPYEAVHRHNLEAVLAAA